MFGISNFFLAALFPIVDAEVLTKLGAGNSSSVDRKSNAQQKHASSFGRVRLWGTLGHVVVIIVSAFAIQRLGYPGMFGVMLTSCASFIMAVMMGIKSSGKGGNHDECR